MSPKSVLIAVVIAAGVFAGSTVAFNRLRIEPAQEPPAAAEPAPPAPEKKVAGPAEKKAEPPPPPAPSRPLILARWAVPKPIGEDKDSFAWHPLGIAVDNAGSRVMVSSWKAVDVWRVGKAAPLRVRPQKFHEAFVAPDAARMYLVAGEPRELQTCDPDGQRIGSWAPPPGPRSWHTFHDAGFDPTTAKLSISLHRSTEAPQGNSHTVQFYEVYSVSPTTGQATVTARLATTQVNFNLRYAPHPYTGGLFVNINGYANTDYTAGLHAVAGGVIRKADRLPLTPTLNWPVVSANGRRIADCFEEKGKVKVFDTRDGRPLFTWKKEYYYASAYRFVGERLVIYASSNYGVMTIGIGSAGGLQALPPLLQMYDVDAVKELGQFEPRARRLPESVFAFSPDGTKLVLANEKEVVLLDAAVAFGLTR